ncbi:hypothetical protein PV783_13940 [Chitinophaga sp. CC14]|uniref:hypothetical protein n=1 Tax=Chitinophaga sp. CC14 TaxID=3029199 RepID=UPI003B78C709
MRIQKVIMMAAFLAATTAAFAFKGVGKGTTIYGKFGGQCQPLCTPTVNLLCADTSDDGIYYIVGGCIDETVGVRYRFP